MSSLASGCLFIIVGIIAAVIGALDYQYPDIQSQDWYMLWFGNKIKGHDIIITIGIILICVGILFLISHLVKKLKKKLRKRKRRHHKYKSGKHHHKNHEHKRHMKPIEQVPRKTCPHCSAKLLPVSKFCNICGEKLDVPAPENEQATETAETSAEN